jgi:hypothetical protein
LNGGEAQGTAAGATVPGRDEVASGKYALQFASSAGPRIGQSRIRDYLITNGRRDLLALPDNCKDCSFIAHKAGSLIAHREKWDNGGRRSILLAIYDFD